VTSDKLGEMRRTHGCNALGKEDIGKEVILMGWVQRRRDHGGVIFVDLRDRDGLTQVVFNPEVNPDVHAKAHVIRSEYVLGVKGEVAARLEGMTNPNLATGEIEIMVSDLKILNPAKTPPFMIEDKIDVSENVRLQHRHIDLRRPQLQQNIILRHKISAAVRQYYNENGFLDIETPVLTKSTPEGARDYLVPSRVNPGNFYALPQSPQLFKQLLMISGYDRYYQIVKCFRDEDLRADRQPEFTQIDVEMSFVGEEDVMAVAEGMMRRVFKEVRGLELATPFPRLDYTEAIDRFGLDKPDTRFGLELKEISDIVADAGFKVFASVVKKGGIVKAINAKGCLDFTRKEIDDDRVAFPEKMQKRPSVNSSLTFNVEWKGIDFSAFINATAGRYDFWQDNLNTTRPRDNRYNFSVFHWADTWNYYNREAPMPRLTISAGDDGGRNTSSSTFWLQSRSYVRLKNLQLGYSLPRNWLQKVHLSRFRIYFTADNLVTFTKWQGIDPEKDTSGDDFYPLLKSFAVGANIEF